jgi:hypothetical protein
MSSEEQVLVLLKTTMRYPSQEYRFIKRTDFEKYKNCNLIVDDSGPIPHDMFMEITIREITDLNLIELIRHHGCNLFSSTNYKLKKCEYDVNEPKYENVDI